MLDLCPVQIQNTSLEGTLLIVTMHCINCESFENSQVAYGVIQGDLKSIKALVINCALVDYVEKSKQRSE